MINVLEQLGEVIDLKLGHQIARPDGDGEELISRDWELPQFFLASALAKRECQRMQH